jgi:predicted RNase H-like nuclease
MLVGKNAMGKRVLTGFDSAWTRRNRGAIISLMSEGKRRDLDGPHTVSFDQALAHIRKVGLGAEVHALAIDQPLIVNNATGRRAVEDVAAHVMGRYGSAVQRANRNKQMMFGDNAPIWEFLTALEKMEFRHKHHANERTVARGRFFFEVYPALGNLGLFQLFYARGMVPCYDPQRRTFNLNDWRLLCNQVGNFLQQRNVQCNWLNTAAALIAPAKRTQDQLDSIICLCHAMSWTGGECGVVVGNVETGYMVVPSHTDLTASLRAHANDHGVTFWPVTV